MSKMSQIHAEMTERINELGYETVEEAIADGWDSAEFYASYKEPVKDEQTKAHEAWLKRKEVVVGDLTNLLLSMHASGVSNTTEYNIINNALAFILDGEQ
jgi:hypothetical protein